MKILMLTPYLPYPLLSGGQIRTYNLLKKLATKHEITLFALIKDESERQHIKSLEPFCAKIKVFKRSQKPFTLKNILKTAVSSYPFLVIRNHVPQTIEAVRRELTQTDYDLIHAETFYMMPHLPTTQVPVILVEQTIEYLGYESYAQKAPCFLKPFLQLDIKKIKHWERHFWQSAQKLIVMSQDDKDYIAQEIGQTKKIEVVSNGVDVDWFDEKEQRLPKQPTVLSVGTFKWLPNVEAVDFLVKKVWPKLKQMNQEARLWIVGNAPTEAVLDYEAEDSQIKVTGNIPDIRDAFKQAHVLAAPVFSGKGTRYKVLEAMAAGTPVVATPTAIEGLGVENGKHVLLAETAQEMAKQITVLFHDVDLRKSLADNAKRYVTEHYDWQYISQKLDQVYQEYSSNKNYAS